MFLVDLARGACLALGMHISRLAYWYAAVLLASVVLMGVSWWVLARAPHDFPIGQPIIIDSGTSVGRAASDLRAAHVISSTLLFKELVRFMPETRGVQSGIYEFKEPVGMLTVAWNLSHGISGIPTARVTFPEGTPARQMGRALAQVLPHFDEQKFDSLAVPHEGYLFPDTYFFLPGTMESQVVSRLEDNYSVHIAKYASAIAASGHSERDIITMASLLEGEGKALEDKRIIAGILWHRIAVGMPLQVDATFGYDYGKTGYVPTSVDLKSNSAYNSYRYTGLPPTPINNPGDESILAALTPTQTSYVYYLTGSDGQMHYAKTLAEHVANEKKYLK